MTKPNPLPSDSRQEFGDGSDSLPEETTPKKMISEKPTTTSDSVPSQSDETVPESRETLVLRLHRDHADDLLAFLIGFLRDADAAREVLQVTFIKAIEGIDRANPETHRGWLFRVAQRSALEHRRRSRRHTDLLKRSTTQHLPSERSPLGFEHPDPLDDLIRWETVQRVRTELDRLPSEQRTIVEARIDHELTFQQIADELDLPLGTVLTRMRLALEKLSRVLRDG